MVHDTQKKNPAPQRGHEFEAHWTTVDKDLSKMEKYALIPGLDMNFFFALNAWSMNDAQLFI